MVHGGSGQVGLSSRVSLSPSRQAKGLLGPEAWLPQEALLHGDGGKMKNRRIKRLKRAQRAPKRCLQAIF